MFQNILPTKNHRRRQGGIINPNVRCVKRLHFTFLGYVVFLTDAAEITRSEEERKSSAHQNVLLPVVCIRVTVLPSIERYSVRPSKQRDHRVCDEHRPNTVQAYNHHV